jgi:hypothetical protein
METQDENVIAETLTPKQERFCQNYTQNYSLFGNATSSYADAYGFELDDMPTNDGKYITKTGIVATEAEILDMEKGDELLRFAKQVEKSTYQKNYDYCSKAGSRMRRNGKIQERCRELLNEFMIDKVIDARLTEIILKGDNSDSIRAIQEFNKLRQRIVDKKDITSGGKPITIQFDSVFNEKSTQQTEGNNLG